MLSFLAFALLSQDWTTLHKDPQRSGFSADVVRGPYERKWYRDFHDEMIASRVEAIVAEGKCFVGTFAGNLHALDVADGKTLWTFKAKGPIGHSPEYRDGRLYVGSDDGRLSCLKASDGGLVWTYEAGAGIWVAPLCDGERVYAGDRAGVFHAVDAKSGARAWSLATDGPILKPASLSEDGKRIVFASEDMRAYCLDPAGKLLWKSRKMAGLSTRDQAPTIWKGLAVVRTAPADGFHEVMNRNQNLLARVQKSIPIGPDDKVLNDQHGAYILRYNAARDRAEQEEVVRYLQENPHDQTFYAFRLEDGKEPWTAPVFYTCGLHNPPTPPAFDPKTGECYTFTRTSLTNYSRGVRPFTGLGRIDRETGRIENLWHAQGDEAGWSDFATIGDETQSLSLMGEVLVSTHQGTLGGLHTKTRKWHPIHNARDTYGGIFGPGALPGGWDAEKRMQREGWLVNMANEWHGPDKSILAIAARRLFWVTGSQVVCWGGPDVPRAESGGTKPPAPVRKRFEFVVTAGGNLTADRVGGFDEKVERVPVTAEQLRPFLDPPKPGAAPQALRARLDAAVLEVVEGGPWAPFVAELGISREERHFDRASQSVLALSLALPYLSPPVAEKARTWIEKPAAELGGRRRELYDLGPGMQRFAAAPLPPVVEDPYAAWARAHYGGAWDGLLSREAELRKSFDEIKPAKIDPKDRTAGARTNAQIAAALGYARIIRKAGKGEEVERALAKLAELVTERVHHERADTNFVREVRGAHSGSIPRYHDLVPELAAMLRAFAPKEFERNVRALDRQLPVWYQAFAERMAGGENYTHTPLIARGLFAALADGLQAPVEELLLKIDQPWCRADLYFIEKLAALARRS
jgi:hypothetical protein